MAVFIGLWSTSIESEFGVLLPGTGGPSKCFFFWTKRIKIWTNTMKTWMVRWEDGNIGVLWPTVVELCWGNSIPNMWYGDDWVGEAKGVNPWGESSSCMTDSSSEASESLCNGDGFLELNTFQMHGVLPVFPLWVMVYITGVHVLMVEVVEDLGWPCVCSAVPKVLHGKFPFLGTFCRIHIAHSIHVRSGWKSVH